MKYKTIITNTKGHVGILTLNRPEDGNRETLEMHEEILSAMKEFEKDREIRVVIINATGRDFCLGASYGRFEDATPLDLYRVYEEVESWRTSMMDFPKATIAAVQGIAQASGAHIAYNADITIMEEEAQIAANAIDAGIPCIKSFQKIAKMVGHKKAVQMVLTGEFLSAKDAERFCLISKIAPKGKLMEVTMEMANLIASKNPVGVQFFKDSIRIIRDMGLRDSGEFTSSFIPLLMTAEDTKEAMKAKEENRKPVFKGFCI